MEDQDKRTEEQEDVEAHKRRRTVLMAGEEASDEGESDDVEAHRGKAKNKFQASEDSPDAEGEGEDFELHRRNPKAY